MKEHLLNDIKDIKNYWAKTYQKWADKIQIGDYINCSEVISASTKKIIASEKLITIELQTFSRLTIITKSY